MPGSPNVFPIGKIMKKLISLHLRDNDVGALTQQVQQGIKAPAERLVAAQPEISLAPEQLVAAFGSLFTMHARTVDGSARYAAHESASSQGGKIVYVK
jgi:hypothetical protein